MRVSRHVGVISVFVLFSVAPVAAEPDFFMIFSECKNVTAPFVLTKNPIRILQGDPAILACNRVGDKITCQLTFEEGKEGIKDNSGDFKIVVDSPPLLFFQLIVGTEFIGVNTANNTAVMSSLMLNENYLGSKVCHGVHLTNFQYKALQKSKR